MLKACSHSVLKACLPQYRVVSFGSASICICMAASSKSQVKSVERRHCCRAFRTEHCQQIWRELRQIRQQVPAGRHLAPPHWTAWC